MRGMIGLSAKFKPLVLAIAVVIPVLGLVQLRSAAVDVYPEFMPPSVEIQAEALGLSAAEVEQLITVPLEQDLLNGVPWLDRIRSRSMPGLSAIDLVFQPGTDILAARQMVQERLTQAHALPNVGSPPIMIEPLASASRVAMIGLASTSVSLVDLSVLARWKIKPRLMGVPGVANVSIYGLRDRQLQVQVDPDRLARSGVSLTQVIETAGNALWVSPLTFVEASTPGTGGFVESANQRLAIQHIQPISTTRQLAAVPVEGVPGGRLKLGDVTKVVEDHQPLIGDALTDAGPSLVMVVEKFPGANTRAVTKGIDDAVASMQQGLPGVTVDTTQYRPGTFIDDSLHNLGRTALIALALLVLLALVLFRSWRAALVGIVVAPLSLVTAAGVLHLRGTTLSSITLLGLAIAVGILVDEAIVDVDAVRRRLAQRRASGETGSPTAAVLEACAEARGSAVYATLVLLLATVPFLAMSTLTAAFTRPLVLSYALAVLAAFAVALVVTPALVLTLLPNGSRPDRESPLASRVRRGAVAASAPFIRRPRRALALAGVLALAALAVIPQLGSHPLLPVMQDRNLLVHVESLPGTALTEMNRVAGAVSKEIRALPGVRNVGVHVGRAITSDQRVDVNAGELWVTVDQSADYARTRSAIQAVLNGYPGVRTDLTTYPTDRVAAAKAGIDEDLVVRVYGEDIGTLRAKAEELRTMLAGVDGVVAPAVEPLAQQPTVDIQVDLGAALRYGLRPGDVRRHATTMVSGLTVGNLYEQQKIFDVVVRGNSATQHSLTSLRNLLLDTPNGGQVRLGDVASVQLRPEPAVLKHDEVRRSVDVVAKVRGRSPAAVTADVKRRLEGVPMPFEYHAEVLGSATVQQGVDRRVLGLGIAAAVGIFLLLQAAVGSWRRALALFAVLPLSGVGAVLLAPTVGGIRSAGALAGLFAVLGIAVRTGLMLARRMVALEHGGAGQDAAAEAARERAVPVVQAALMTAGVLLPFAMLGGRAGLEILRPLAVTVLGGLVTATLVTLVVLPGLLRMATAAPAAPFLPPQPRLPDGAVEQSDARAKTPAPIGLVHRRRRLAVVLVVLAAGLAGCGPAEQAPADESPVTLQDVPGSDVKQVVLTEEAVDRLGIATKPVQEVRRDSAGRPSAAGKVIPYAAVVYDSDGSTWAFTSTKPGTYLRQPIEVQSIDGDAAILRAGPPTGTAVVTVGAMELLGAEYEISGEE